jgi:hypothetical protein
MRKLILALAVVAGFGVLAQSASATTITVNPNPTYFTVQGVGGGSNFSNGYIFQLTAPTSDVSFGALAGGIIGLSVQLYDCGISADCASKSLIETAPKAGNFLLSLAGDTINGLTSAYYEMVISGKGLPLFGGGYLAAINVTATPIPPALVMFLTALGGLGFFGYRHRAGLSS